MRCLQSIGVLSCAKIAVAIDAVFGLFMGAGVEHVGIGADFYDVLPDSMAEGLENVTRYPYLFAELLRRGDSDDDVLKIAGRTHLRAIRQMETVAAELRKTEAALITEGRLGSGKMIAANRWRRLLE